MDCLWGKFAASEQEAVITVSCGGDDEQKWKEDESRGANQIAVAAWHIFVSDFCKIYSYCLKEKSLPLNTLTLSHQVLVDFMSSFVTDCWHFYSTMHFSCVTVEQWCNILQLGRKGTDSFILRKKKFFTDKREYLLVWPTSVILYYWTVKDNMYHHM